MPTAYTSLLGLALPVTGELSGTWGDTVNNSITSLLDTSVAGTTNVSTDADVTLTTTTGASNTARQAILLFSGARTALRTVTAPAQSKIYTVINATTGGFSVKLVGVGPTTGVTIVAGESAVCAWNGSDFVKVSNTGGSASFVNLTASGTVTFTGLTASQAVFTNASDELVSNAITGTGSVVMSASPTLTGTIGAAAATLSGNLTLSGGTANGVAYLNGSKVVTSGSALTFDGTSLGVGTTSPASLLAVAGSTSTTLGLSISAGGWNNARHRLTVPSSGDESVWSWNYTGSALDSSSYGTASIGLTSNVIKFATATTNTAPSEQMRLTSTGLIVGGTAATNTSSGRGNITINGSSSAILSMGTGGTAKGYVYHSGSDMIINATTGTLALQANGNGALINTSGGLSVGTATDAGTGNIGLPAGGKLRYSSTAYITPENNVSGAEMSTTGVITFLTGSGTPTERCRIDASGNLGIGTSSPSYKLQVASGATAATSYFSSTATPAYSATAYNGGNARIAMVGGGASGATTGINFSQGGSFEAYFGGVQESGGAAAFVWQGYSGSAYAERMRLGSSGNLGIGTSSPVYKLVVSNGGASGIEFGPAFSGTANLIQSYNRSGSAYVNTVYDANEHIFNTIGTERARIDSSGKVLIGTTTNNFASRLVVFNDASYTIESQRTTTASEGHMAFANANGAVGSIFTSGTTTAFNTSSDYRLKNTIAPMTGALAKVAQLKPVTYKWNADGSDGQGFIAHELAEVCPDAVTGEKDAVDAKGNPQYQGIDVSFLVATLTAAIKEQQAIIESLKARLDAANL